MPRPQLKDNVPHFTADGAVHFRLSGELISFDDPDGRVGALLRLLDGTREVDDVYRDLRSAYPDVTPTDIAEAVREFDDERLIQDATDVGADFSPTEHERWSRNLGFFEVSASLATSKYEFQRRIRDAKVAVLGVGGVGTHALIDLVVMGFTDIRIVDFDTVDLSNLNRQILYGEQYVGQAKATIARERALAMNSSLRIDAVQTKIMSAETAYELVRDRDIVIAGVDRPKTTILHWLNEGCVRAGAALIGGGVDGGRAVVYTTVPGVSGCLECWYAQVRENDPTSSMLQDELEGLAAQGHTFSEDRAAFNGLVVLDVAQMVGEVVRLATGISPVVSLGRVLEMTFQDPTLREAESWERRPDCATCATAAPRPALRWGAREVMPAQR